MSRLLFGGISGKTVVTAGWGSVTNSGDKPRFLHKANLRVIERETCLMNLIAWNDPPDYVLNHFCTVGESKTTAIACVRYILFYISYYTERLHLIYGSVLG